MNVRPGHASRKQASVWRRWAGGAALALTLFPAQGPAAEARKAADDPPPRAVPRLLILPDFTQPGTIRWRNGESLEGKLVEIGAGGVAWSSPVFKSPLLLRREPLERIDFSSPPLEPQEPFRVILTDGAQLHGTPEKWENGLLFLRSAHSGLVELKQESLAFIERTGGGGVITGGPQSLLKRPLPPAPEAGSPASPWYFTAAGQLASNSFRQGLTLPRKLPEKSAVECLLSCDRQPEFSLKLTADEGSCAVETWGDELVLTDGEEFASAGTVIPSGTGQALVRIAWDRPSGRRVLYSAEGKVLAELTVPPGKKTAPPAARRKKAAAPGGLAGALKQLLGLNAGTGNPEATPSPPVENGITFQNKGAGVVLERFTLSEWTGDTLAPLLGGKTGLETSGEALPGELAGISSSTLTLRGADGQTRDFPLATVRAFRWERPVKMERDASLTDLWFADGDLLRGRLSEAKEGIATMEIAASAQPLNSKWEGARMLMLPLPDKDKKREALEPLEKFDTLSPASGSKTLHGTILTEGQGPLPKFSPIGAVAPVELASAPSLTLTWAKPPEKATGRAPALLYMKGGETLPVKTAGLERGTLQFAWEEAAPRRLDPSLIQALQFSAPPVAMGGFDDPGWQVLGTGKDKEKKPASQEGKNGQITLTPGMGLAHPYLLQGGGVSFRMTVVSGLGSIRVKLFSLGADRSSAGVNFMIADFGGTVYAGLEQGEGQIDSQQNIPSTSGRSEIRCTFQGDMAEVFVNGVSIGRAAPDPKNRKKCGIGMIIETASLWGNQMGSVKLSDCIFETPPFQVPPPLFTAEAKQEALLLPRARRADPPKQVLIGRNGDLLRGEIEAMTSTHLAFRSGVENFKVPIDRVAAAVWVKKLPPASKDKVVPGKEGEEKEPAQDEQRNGPEEQRGEGKSGPPDGRQWLDLTNGGRLALTISSWNEREVTATHSLLGELRIPIAEVACLRLETPTPGTARNALTGWALTATPDPVLPDADSGSSLSGTEAPDFKLALLEGGDFSLKKYQGKVVVLDFWATWCGPCVKSLPGLVEAMAQFPPEQVAFLAVNQGETKEQISRFLEARHLTMAVALDTDQAVAPKYGVEGIPHTVVIAPDGKIASIKTGYSPDGEKQIAEAVSQALKGNQSEKPEKTISTEEKTPSASPPSE